MTDNMTPSPEQQPAVQPVSIHDSHHGPHHGALPLITAMLGVIVVLESIALGYVAMRYHERWETHQEAVENNTTLGDKIQDAKDKAVPFLYVEDGKKLYQVDRQTGAQKLIYSHTSSPRYISIFAIPQVGYSGKVYLSEACAECDSSGFSVLELDLSQDDPTPVTVGAFERSSVTVAPDQTKFAYVSNDDGSVWETGNEIYVVNLLDQEGEDELLADGDGLYFFSSFDTNEGPQPSMSGYNFSWSSMSCVSAGLYERPQTDIPMTSGSLTYVKLGEFCQE